MQTGRAVAAAHLLLQSAEAAFPKQKKSLVVAEFKQAKVAHKRRSKAHQEDKGPAQLPQDVLVHIFRLLNLQSLISARLVCWSWNFAANDNHLWESQYTIFFSRSVNEDLTHLEENVISRTDIDWKKTFKIAYKDIRSKKFMSGREYCGHCDTLFETPISPHEVVAYVIDDYISEMSFSKSDNESMKSSFSDYGHTRET